MTRRRIISFGGLVLLTFLLALGCTLLLREDSAAGAEWYIKLRIQAPASSKGITVDELDVTGMLIEVMGPEEDVLQSIDWVASEGSQEYLVALPQPGGYRLEVTHFADREGVPVQAEERAAFQIQAMKITVIDVVPGGIGLVWVATGQKQDGTITGRLAGAMDFNGLDGAFLVLPAGAAISPDTILGSGLLLITGGSAEGIVKESLDALEPIVFTGGGLYDVYAYIDLGGDDFPTKGDYWAGPKTVQVDADMFVDFTYPTDFEQLASGFPSFWQIWGTWINEDYNGMGGPPAKVVMHEDGTIELFWNTGDPVPFQTTQGDITGEWTDAQAHWFQSLVEGPIYVLTRLFDEGNTFTNRSSTTGYPDPSDFGPTFENYFVIYYRQQ